MRRMGKGCVCKKMRQTWHRNQGAVFRADGRAADVFVSNCVLQSTKKWHEYCWTLVAELLGWSCGWNRTTSESFPGADAFAPDAAIAAVPAGTRDGAAVADPAGDRD